VAAVCLLKRLGHVPLNGPAEDGGERISFDPLPPPDSLRRLQRLERACQRLGKRSITSSPMSTAPASFRTGCSRALSESFPPPFWGGGLGRPYAAASSRRSGAR